MAPITHGWEGGCKLAFSVPQRLLSSVLAMQAFPNWLAGLEAAGNAGIAVTQ